MINNLINQPPIAKSADMPIPDVILSHLSMMANRMSCDSLKESNRLSMESNRLSTESNRVSCDSLKESNRLSMESNRVSCDSLMETSWVLTTLLKELSSDWTEAVGISLWISISSWVSVSFRDPFFIHFRNKAKHGFANLVKMLMYVPWGKEC